MLRVLIADDHPLFREALTHVVGLVDADAQCAQAATLSQALALIDSDEAFDLVLLDLGLPGASGLSGVLAVRTRAASTPVVIVSASEEIPLIRQAARMGVNGYLPKSAAKEAMAAGLERVLRGETEFPDLTPADSDSQVSGIDALTPRQMTVLQRLGEGKSNKQIAYELSISQETVKIHITAILRKLGVASRAQAILVANRLSAPARAS